MIARNPQPIAQRASQRFTDAKRAYHAAVERAMADPTHGAQRAVDVALAELNRARAECARWQ